MSTFVRSPKLAITENSRHTMRFTLSETDVSVANAIRRTMIAEVPTMAIDLVTVYENTSALADEYIVHRLGLIPLKSENIDYFNYARDCECDDYCDRCSVSFSLHVHVASDETTARKVTSADLAIENEPAFAENQRVKPVNNSGDDAYPDELSGIADEMGILIARLSCGQKLRMRALARKGIAKDHAKWSPMCTVSYRIMPPAVELNLDIINDLLSLQAKKELVAASQGLVRLHETAGSTGILEYETPFLKGRIAITPDTTRKAGELAIEAGGKAHQVVRYNHTPECFEFFAETTGAMTPIQALHMAIGIVKSKVNTVFSHVR